MLGIIFIGVAAVIAMVAVPFTVVGTLVSKGSQRGR